MELKLLPSAKWSTKTAVLIVPLWNWNEEAANGGNTFEAGFNRTFMELKYWTGITTLDAAASFNRTFMELKWSGHGCKNSKICEY